jgi:alkylation response protein AidB-like acyl-CoA dehydrogenase
MTISEVTTTGAEVLERVRLLGPDITERAPEIEAGRRVPPALVDQLREAGCFRLIRPTSHGGVGASLPEAMRVFETLARADGSTGWTVMIGAGSWLDLANLHRATFDALYLDHPDAITAGVFSPSGSATPVDGGYEVTGRWGFASGCEHADVLFGNCMEGVVDGVPQLRIAVFSPEQVVIEDTWTVSGLSGSGSHHFHADRAFVPADRTCSPLAHEPCLDDPIVRLPPPPTLGLVLGSVALGIARGAVDDILALAGEKVPLLSPTTLAGNAVFHLDLANADTELQAIRALLYDGAEELWTAAVEGEPLSMETRARMRAAGVWSAEHAATVVASVYRAGGGTSLYATSPLQRRLRDINALAQHFLVRRDTLVTAGAILAGQDVEVMVF